MCSGRHWCGVRPTTTASIRATKTRSFRISVPLSHSRAAAVIHHQWITLPPVKAESGPPAFMVNETPTSPCCQAASVGVKEMFRRGDVRSSFAWRTTRRPTPISEPTRRLSGRPARPAPMGSARRAFDQASCCLQGLQFLHHAKFGCAAHNRGSPHRARHRRLRILGTGGPGGSVAFTARAGSVTVRHASSSVAARAPCSGQPVSPFGAILTAAPHLPHLGCSAASLLFSPA